MDDEIGALEARLDEASPAHPGRHLLARFEAGELDDPSALAAHLDVCARCAGLVAEMGRDRQAFLALRPPATLQRPTPAPSLAARLRLWLVGPTLVAAGLAWWLVPREAPAPAGVRLKGAVDLGFHVRSDGEVRRGELGDVVHPGDQVQLRYSTPQHRYLVVVSLDARGAVTPFYDDAGRSLAIEPGTARLLDGSVELDDALGPERVVACFSAAPLETARVVEAGRRALTAAGGDPRAVEPLDLPCDQAGFVLEKRGR